MGLHLRGGGCYDCCLKEGREVEKKEQKKEGVERVRMMQHCFGLEAFSTAQ